MINCLLSWSQIITNKARKKISQEGKIAQNMHKWINCGQWWSSQKILSLWSQLSSLCRAHMLAYGKIIFFFGLVFGSLHNSIRTAITNSHSISKRQTVFYSSRERPFLDENKFPDWFNKIPFWIKSHLKLRGPCIFPICFIESLFGSACGRPISKYAKCILALPTDTLKRLRDNFNIPLSECKTFLVQQKPAKNSSEAI